MSAMLKEIRCADAGFDCGFLVRSHDTNEVVYTLRQHARRVHETEIERGVIEEKILVLPATRSAGT
ncbi:DUF1059 domain-containing protein [Natronomonas sp. EA1]|uniref:DUF1059 domain-containing protein n=1 Tax=Natronomonas sp. EA1 TaxID=3421655 RepID=UPI003EBD5188